MCTSQHHPAGPRAQPMCRSRTCSLTPAPRAPARPGRVRYRRSPCRAASASWAAPMRPDRRVRALARCEADSRARRGRVSLYGIASELSMARCVRLGESFLGLCGCVGRRAHPRAWWPTAREALSDVFECSRDIGARPSLYACGEAPRTRNPSQKRDLEQGYPSSIACLGLRWRSRAETGVRRKVGSQ